MAVSEMIMAQLRAKFEGVDGKILEKAAARLAKSATTEEAAKTAVEAFGTAQLLELYGDSRAQGATQTAILNYEKKHGLRDGQRVDAPTDEPARGGGDQTGGDDQRTDGMAKITQTIAQLQAELSSLRAGRVEETRRGKLKAVIGQLPEALQKPYQRMAVADMSEEAFEVLLGEVQGDVESVVQQVQVKGALFTPPVGNPGAGGGGGAEASPAEVEEVVKRLPL